jgi:RNA polymerase sigma factor (sigma-70 family)
MPDANTMSEETEDDICRRALAGSKSSLTIWLQTKQPALLKHAKARLPPQCRPVLSESDIVQVTMLRAVRGFSKIREKTPETANSWLFTIQNNHLRTQAVKFANQGHFRVSGPFESMLTWAKLQRYPARQDSTPSDEAIRAEQDTLIEQAISHLNVENQTIFIAMCFEGKKASEVASEVGKSPDAIRKNYKRLVDRIVPWIESELRRRKS